ncbi:MAG: biopolymer transporter ExbD [Planctomycetia bacterium]|nr:biopolymer transporter ExbD [Planctomycetia bacterium]
MALQIPRRRRKPISIDMSPLIDCIFQLLIFFMLSSTFLTPSIKLTLPTAVAPTNAVDQHIMVTLGADDETYVNQDRVDESQLLSKLSEVLAPQKEKVVTIRGDEKIPYGRFVKALEAAKAAGASDVNVAHAVPD